MKKLWAVSLFAGLLSGCAAPQGSYVSIPDPTTSESFISIKGSLDGKIVEEQGARVETVGSDTVVTLLKNRRKHTFRNLTGYRGTLHTNSAELEIGEVRVSLSEEHLEVVGPDYTVRQTINRTGIGDFDPPDGYDIEIDRTNIKFKFVKRDKR